MRERILDNPKKYFESLTEEEFNRILNEFGFEYIDIKDKSIEEINKLTMRRGDKKWLKKRELS